MELKSIKAAKLQNEFSSNRTFMELKLGETKSGLSGRPVLIVPLWN